MEDAIISSANIRIPFVLDNGFRNDALLKMGFKPPQCRSTGTTIAGLVYDYCVHICCKLLKDGIVIGADSRATSGNIIGDKYCMKLHELAKNIYMCGSGTAADLDQLAHLLSANMELLKLTTERKPRGVAAVRIARQHLFKHMGYIGAYVIIAGTDFTGPFLYSVHAHGSSIKDNYLADGSGCLAAYGVLETNFKLNMTLDEALDLLKRALIAGMAADVNSGNTYTFAILKKNSVEIHTRNVPDFCEPIPKMLAYRYPPKTTKVLKQIKYDVVSSTKMME
ncbi:Proteasome subunit beta type-7 [Trichinella spiralis]|uniref:proteasome endopeptidase complex n=1 Tax=Trichinella spiralis TaxID=6334 RepID=A0A0V1B8Q5_TRISP|nr:Proteasome subunit beta type-7 [Trichinella spiralis]